MQEADCSLPQTFIYEEKFLRMSFSSFLIRTEPHADGCLKLTQAWNIESDPRTIPVVRNRVVVRIAIVVHIARVRSRAARPPT